MCQALREWAEEERSIGREERFQTGRQEGHRTGLEEGLQEGRRAIIRNMLLRGMSDEDIMAIAECDQEFIEKVRKNI